MHRAMHEDEESASPRAFLAETQATLATEAPLLGALSRRVQDNTRLILGLLALQADRAGDPEGRRELGELAARALGIAHERLDRARGATVDLAPYLRELCDHLTRFYLGLGIDLALAVRADHAAVATGDAVTLGLIINELVADGAGRAIAGRAGEIRVELRAAAGAGKGHLAVADDGRSLPEGCCEEPGWRLVEGLAAQLGAELAVARSPKRGLHAVLAFPLPAR